MTPKALVFIALSLTLPVTSLGREELRIPATTAYLIPDPDAARVAANRPITPFVKDGASIAWYGHFGVPGTVNAAVALILPAKDSIRLRLQVGRSSREALAIGTGSEMRLDFGPIVIPDSGYHQFDLVPASGKAAIAVDVRALLLDGTSMAQAHFNLDPRRNAASVHLRFPTDTGAQITGFYQEVTAVDDPIASYYMACGFARGYFGMQVNGPNERRIIFSVWDAASGSTAADRSTVDSTNYTQLLAKGDGVEASVFGNEGTGGHSHLVYPWKTGSTQRFFVTAKVVGSATDYTGYWFNPDKAAWVLIASFRAAKDGRGLRGLYAFSENFGGNNGNLRRKALYGPQWIRLANGDWQELTKATFSHDATGKENRLDRFMGVENGRFFLSHGGFVSGYTASGTAFTRPATGKPPVIVLPENEDVAVYAAALNSLFPVAQGAAKNLIVLSESSRPRRAAPFPSVPPGMTGADTATVANFMRRTDSTLSIRAVADSLPRLLTAKMVLVHDSIISAIFPRTPTSPSAPLASRWDAFYRRFPGALGYVGVSAIGYGRGGTEAMLLVEESCGGLCGWGKIVLLRKTAGAWQVAGSFMSWIS